MPFTRSTPDELAACASLIFETERAVQALVAAGKSVHLVWDVDHVLVSGRSDDAFALLGYDVARYFAFEERLVAERMEDGPWASFARRSGELHASQDIVTARSTFAAMRVMFWCLEWNLSIRWQLFVGHQPKAESYRIILKSFEKDPNAHVFMVDDAAKHVDTFDAIAKELGVSGRAHGILSPQIRQYDEAEMRREVDGVMGLTGDKPAIIWSRDRTPDDMGRYLTAVPDGRAALRKMYMGFNVNDVFIEAVVEQNREWLEKFADEVMPGKPKTTKNLYFLYEIIREPR